MFVLGIEPKYDCHSIRAAKILNDLLRLSSTKQQQDIANLRSTEHGAFYSTSIKYFNIPQWNKWQCFGKSHLTSYRKDLVYCLSKYTTAIW